MVLFISGMAVLQSCQKNLLNTVPNDRISTDIFWKTDNDATLAANAIYTYMAETPDHFFGWDCMSDIIFTNPTGPVEASIKEGQYNALNSRISLCHSRMLAAEMTAPTATMAASRHVMAIQTIAADTAPRMAVTRMARLSIAFRASSVRPAMG